MACVKKFTISLISEEVESLRNAVEAGEYTSTSEAIRDAVRGWRERRDLLGYSTEELRQLFHEGLESGPSQHASLAELKSEARRCLARSNTPDRS